MRHTPQHYTLGVREAQPSLGRRHKKKDVQLGNIGECNRCRTISMKTKNADIRKSKYIGISLSPDA